eukprot:755889-Hanusia_phi.AAC.13
MRVCDSLLLVSTVSLAFAPGYVSSKVDLPSRSIFAHSLNAKGSYSMVQHYRNHGLCGHSISLRGLRGGSKQIALPNVNRTNMPNASAADGKLQTNRTNSSMTKCAWDPKQRVWVLYKRPTDNWSVESLKSRWNFSPDECLVFRHRKPDKWQEIPDAPGWLGCVEFCMFVTPIMNFVLFMIRGLNKCAVCGKGRREHPLQTSRDADRAFWEAVAERDIELAVRIVRGGLECPPGGHNFCLVTFLIANYCKDAFKNVPDLDQEKAHYHLNHPPEFRRGWFGYYNPFL